MVGRTGLNVTLTFVRSWMREVILLELQSDKLASGPDLADKGDDLPGYGTGLSLFVRKTQ